MKNPFQALQRLFQRTVSYVSVIARTRSFWLWSLFYVGLFLYYYLMNVDHTGPVYPTDEIGYLSKAQALAGYEITTRTSWHGGYSFFIAPLVHLFSEPEQFWRGVVALNSLLLTSSLLMLRQFLVNLFPKASQKTLFIVVLLCALYPAWVSMAGYAFPTAPFVFMVMLFSYLFVRLDMHKWLHAVAVAAAAGFTYWIHPIGITVVGALILVYTIQALKERRLISLLLVASVGLGMLAVYALVVHPWFDVLTSRGFEFADNQVAYSFIGDNVDQITARNFLGRVPLIYLGGLAYLLIGTLGFIALSWVRSGENTVKLLRSKRGLKQTELILIILVVALFGAILMGVLAFYVSSLSNQIRPDHLIYGRYAEMVFLPLLGASLLLPRKSSYVYTAASILLLAGLVFYIGADRIDVDSTNFDQIHTPALWPRFFIEELEYITWFILGGIGILAATTKRVPLLVAGVLVVSFVAADRGQQWHQYRAQFARPDGLYHFVDDALNGQGCMGFWAVENDFFSVVPDQFKRDRIELYKYYLGSYHPQKMDYPTWEESDCEAYITTEDLSDARFAVSYEEPTGLFIVLKDSAAARVEDMSGYSNFYVNTDPANNRCATMLRCFSRDAEEVAPFSLVGELRDDGAVHAVGESGILLFGPYTLLEPEEYMLLIDATIPEGQQVRVSVADGPSVLASSVINGQSDSEEYGLSFALDTSAAALEVKIEVTAESSVSVNGYRIVLDQK